MIKEKEIIKSFKQLRKISPDKEWVASLAEQFREKKENFLFFPVPKAGLIVSFLVIISVLLGGALVYTFFPLEVEKVKIITKINNNEENRENLQVIASLGKIQRDLALMREKINGLKKARNSVQALVATQVIRNTAENISKTVTEIKNKQKGIAKEVLASLQETKESSEELAEKAREATRDLLAKIIENLEKEGLTKEDQERLAKAKEFFEKKDYNSAVFFLSKIMTK